MTAAQARKHGYTFLGKMLTDPKVLADVKAIPVIGKGKSRGKDPRVLAKVLRQHLGLRATPAAADAQKIGAHVQRAMGALAAKVKGHAPRQAATLTSNYEFYPHDFYNDW
jgi:hypothetical protein